MMNCCGIAHLWGQTTGVPVLSGFSSSSIMTCLCSREKNVIGTRVSLPKSKQLVSPFCHPSIYQLSTLEKTKLCHRPTLSSVLSTNFQQLVCGGTLTRDLRHGRQQVAPFNHLSHSKKSDFHRFSSPGFLTPKMTELREPLQ